MLRQGRGVRVGVRPGDGAGQYRRLSASFAEHGFVRHGQGEYVSISGRSYRVGGVVLDRHQASPVAFVEAFATRATVGDRFAEFYDLRKAHQKVRMLAVYDDAIQWPKADLALLEQVSFVVPYSQSQPGLEALA